MQTKIFNLAKYALTVMMGAAMLAACSNNAGSFLAPSGTSSGMPTITHIGRMVMVNGVPITAAHPNLIARQSGVFTPDKFLPDKKKKKKQPYQYISNFGNGRLLEFDYPKGDSPIGSISYYGLAPPQGECTNVLFGSGKQTFWVTNSASFFAGIEEFEVGGSRPIKTLVTGAGDIPAGCAIDPATGDLAASIITDNHVDIYKNASTIGVTLTTPLAEVYFCGYDAKSDLYCDGFTSTAVGLVKLPHGTSTWVTLSGVSIKYPGGVQWDGKYITVNDQEAHHILGYTCSSGSCTLERTVVLEGAGDCDQTWIAKGYVICPDAGHNEGEIYKYPAGGHAIAHLVASSGFSEPLGSVQAVK